MWLCVALKEKAASFFEPSQFGVTCPNGAEKVIHGLRACMDKHWFDDDFGVLKIDMKNAFNLVSRQALLSECAKHFPELFPWVSWCYGQHPLLWHSLGCLTSESGVQQGDPLGPLLFSLVLNILVKAISTTCSTTSSITTGTWMIGLPYAGLSHSFNQRAQHWEFTSICLNVKSSVLTHLTCFHQA